MASPPSELTDGAVANALRQLRKRWQAARWAGPSRDAAVIAVLAWTGRPLGWVLALRVEDALGLRLPPVGWEAMATWLHHRRGSAAHWRIGSPLFATATGRPLHRADTEEAVRRQLRRTRLPASLRALRRLPPNPLVAPPNAPTEAYVRSYARDAGHLPSGQDGGVRTFAPPLNGAKAATA